MSNDPSEKQSPAPAPEANPPAQARPESPEEEFPPDLDWQLRAHPVVEKRPAQAEEAKPAKKEVPAAATARPAAPTLPKPPAPAPAASDATGQKAEVPAAARPKPVPPVPATMGAPPPANKPAATAPSADGETKPAAPAAPPAAAPPKPAAAAPPRAPAAATPKEAPPKPEPLDNELVKRYRSRFGNAIREAWTDRKQAILVVAPDQLVEIAKYSRDEEKFDMLTDLTALDWPKREKRFDIILNLYSFVKNERLRLKVHVGENEPVPSVTGVWGAANWLEREAFDMFGIRFEGHPNLKRILLPDEWQGHPLRKDYDILTQDTAWVRENLGIESGQ